jgi:GNAT superfamily N-acetyltransferase
MSAILRPMREDDLPEADWIFRRAFGTHFRLADPMTAFGDADYVYSRWRASAENTVAAELDGRLIGSNFVARWGSVAFFGPLTVDPTAWDKGVGKQLVAAAVERFDDWNVAHRGLFTFPESPKHISLYRGFGFWPRFLTGLMSRAIDAALAGSVYRRWSKITADNRENTRLQCWSITNAIYVGLNVSSEIEAVSRFSLGDTILVGPSDRIEAFAVCHCGPRTEAGSGVCYVKFAAVRPGPVAPDTFRSLLTACEHFAMATGCQRVVCGMNYGRHEAMNILVGMGYRTDALGVTMHGNSAEGYSQPGRFVVDDWR